MSIRPRPLSLNAVRSHVKPRRVRLAQLALRVIVANTANGGEIPAADIRQLIEIVTDQEWPLFEIRQALRLLRLRGLVHCTATRRSATYRSHPQPPTKENP